MSVSQAIIRINYATLTAEPVEEAIALRESVLDKSAAIARVTDADEQRVAVESQAEIATLLRDAEKARVSCKEPVLEFGRNIDLRAREFVADLKLECNRIAGLIGEFQALEQKRAMAREAERNEQLLQVERDRHAALAQATSHDQVDAIQTHFDERVAVEAPPVSGPPRADGQIVRNEWVVDVTSTWVLALWAHEKGHQECVRINPCMGEIKALLNAGVKVAGVIAKREIKASVRAGTARAAIEV